jgi:mono/diheme cytochrome c family protein
MSSVDIRRFIIALTGIGIAIGALLLLPGGGTVNRGKAVYTEYCANCHGDNGEGIRGLVPPMAHPYMLDAKRIICAVRYGKRGEIDLGDRVYSGWMLPFTELEEDAMADIINYVWSRWGGGESGRITVLEVSTLLDQCEARSVNSFN